MINSFKVLIITTLMFNHFVNAENQNLSVELATSQCVYIDGDKDCIYKAEPIKNLIIKLTKNSNGKYFSYNELSTYVGSNQFKASIVITKDNLNATNSEVMINLIAQPYSGEKKYKISKINITDLSQLQNLIFYGKPIGRYEGHYYVETEHKIKFH